MTEQMKRTSRCGLNGRGNLVSWSYLGDVCSRLWWCLSIHQDAAERRPLGLLSPSTGWPLRAAGDTDEWPTNHRSASRKCRGSGTRSPKGLESRGGSLIEAERITSRSLRQPQRTRAAAVSTGVAGDGRNTGKTAASALFSCVVHCIWAVRSDRNADGCSTRPWGHERHLSTLKSGNQKGREKGPQGRGIARFTLT